MIIRVARIESMDMIPLWFLELYVEEGQSTTIQTVKEKIHRAKGIPINQQTLIFGGKSINDNHKILGDYNNIQDGCTLKLVVKPPPLPRPFEKLVCDDYYEALIHSHTMNFDNSHYMHKMHTMSNEVEFEYIRIEEKEYIPKDVTIVRFHSSVTEVGDRMFQDCRQLKKVVLNEGLRKIGNFSFRGCIKLEHINLPSTITEVGDQSFYDCVKLKDVVFNEGLQTIGKQSFYGCKLFKRITFPSTITAIGDSAFCGCYNLGSVILNEALQTIEKGAFATCSSLKHITIPRTVTELGSSAFFNCQMLREVQLNEGLSKIENSAFSGCPLLERISFPHTVTEIGSRAFYECTRLREVILHEGIQKIGSCAFEHCSSLEHITIPSNVTKISKSTFYNCLRLREVELHEGIQIIASDAFNECPLLERFTFPSLSTRLESIIQAGQSQTEVEDRVDENRGIVERRGSNMFISEVVWVRVRRLIQGNNWGVLRGILGRIDRLITYYELKEATTVLELAMWKAKIDQANTNRINRDEYRLDIPGPVKDTILQYLQSPDDSEDDSSSSSSSSSSSRVAVMVKVVTVTVAKV